MQHIRLKSTFLSLSTAMLLGITGCSSGSSDNDAAPLSAALSGIGIDGILMQANVCIDADKSGICELDENATSVQTDNDGKFKFPAGSPTGPLILSGGYDKSLLDPVTGKYLPFEGVLKAPAGSEVVTPLTSAIQAIMDNNSSVSAEDAQATIKTAMGLSDLNVSLTTFDPYNGIDGADSEAAKQILAKQTQLQILVHTAAATIAGADSQTNIDDAMGNVFDSLVKSLATGAEVELDAKTVAIATRAAATETYKNATDKNALVVAVGTVAQAEAEDAVSAANGAEAAISGGTASDAIGALDGAINAVNKEDGASAGAEVTAQATLTDAERTAIITAREAEDAAAKEAAAKEAEAVAARAKADKALAEAQTKDELEAAERLRVEAAEAEQLAAEKAEAEAIAAKAAAEEEAAINAQDAADKLTAAQAAEDAAIAAALQAKIEAQAAEAAAQAIKDADAAAELTTLKADAAAAALAAEQARAAELVNSYIVTANNAANGAQAKAEAVQTIKDGGYSVDSNLSVALSAATSAHMFASALNDYNSTTVSTDLNTTYAEGLKNDVLAQEKIAGDALVAAQEIKGAKDIADQILQGKIDRINVKINNINTIITAVEVSLADANATAETLSADMSYINGVASLYSDASAKATLAQTANTTATDAYDALLVQFGIVKISGEELSTAYNDLNETAAQTAETNAINAQIELNAQLVIMNAQKTVIQGLRIEVAAIEVANRGELKTGVDTLLAPSVVAGVADAKNMFAQIRETAVTFMDFDEPENNTSTIVGSQLDTIKTKIEPAAQAITTSFEESVTAIQNSTESFQTGFEADFNATMSAIETRMDSLMSQTESFPEDANWSVSANGDTLAHTYTNHGDGTVTDVFNLNSQPVTMTSEINDNGDKKPVTASGSIALSGTGYNLSVSEITLTSTGAKVVASGTISGDNDALMTLTTLNITTDVNSSVVDSFSMFQNIAAVLDGSIVVGGRTVAGTVNLTESKMLVTGNYTGLTTEPSFSGDVTLDTSFNSLINDAAKYGESDVGAWNPLLMVTFSDGNKSIVTSYTQTYLPSTSNSNLYEYNLTTQSGQNIIVETNSTYNNVYDEQYGYYRTISKTNSVTVSDGATLTPYYTNEDKISLLTGTNDIAVNNAWYNYDWNSNITSYRLEIDVRGDDSGNIVQNGTITQDGEEVIILDIVQTPNLNLLDRTFDARFNGTLTHGDKKIVASIGADRGLESKIYAQNIEITDGESFITLEELSVTVPNAELFTILEENNDDNHYNGKSQFENYTVNYDEYYDDSENDLDLKNILDAKLTNLQVSLFDTDNEILSLDANISFENRTTISSSFDGSYEYKSTKFNGHMDANGTYTDLANGDTEVVGIANVSGSVEANGFIPFDIVTTAAFTPNGGVEAYTMFTRNATYKLGMQLTRLNDAANATSTTVVKVGDSNGVLGELTTVHTYSTDDDTTPTMNVVDKDGNSLATYGEDVNGNNWEIRYNDPENSSETLF